MKKVLLSALLAMTAAAANAEPVTYNIDNSHTFPSFSYSHMGFSQQTLRFDKTSGSITWDKDAKTASVDITINMASVDTGDEEFDKHIKGADFFDTAKFPTATFKSTSVEFAGDKPTAVTGDLTIKGITKQVTLDITHFDSKTHPMRKKAALGANATTHIKRTEFNAGKYAPMVSDDVTITIAVEALAN